MIIHLNGWPGAGKKTIGQVLAKQLEARFIHNHLLHDVAITCAGFDMEQRWVVYEAVRSAAYNALAKRPKSEVFVMTNALCKNALREQDAWKHVVELAIRRDMPLIPIVLTLDAEENFKRVQSSDRVGKKLSDPKELEGYFVVDSIQIPDVAETFILDVTRLSAEVAAKQIARYIKKIEYDVHSATPQHLQLR